MLVMGIAFLVFAALVEFMEMTVPGAAATVGVVLVILELVTSDRNRL